MNTGYSGGRRRLLLSASVLGAGLLLALGAGGGVAVPAALAQQQPSEVKVALIAPLSGPWARQGELMRLGAEMAIEDINEAGGIESLGGARMRLVAADAGDTAEKAKNAAQRLLAEHPDLVGGTGAWLSSFTLAVTEVTEREKLPWLTLSYSDQITDRGFRYVFQTSPTGGKQSQEALPTILELAESATGERPDTTAIIMDNTAAPVSFAKPMREGGLEQMGVELLVDQTFTPPLSDATPLVQQVRAARPDFLLFLATAIPDDKLVLEKLNEFNLSLDRLPVVSNGAHIGAPDILNVIGADLLEGLLFVVANWGAAGQEELIERFKERTGEPWLTQDSVSSYGDMWILKEALEKAGTTDREQVAEAIRTMDTTEGPAKYFPGGRMAFDEKGRRADADLLIVQWQNGVPVTVFPPESALAEPRWPKS